MAHGINYCHFNYTMHKLTKKQTEQKQNNCTTMQSVRLIDFLRLGNLFCEKLYSPMCQLTDYYYPMANRFISWHLCKQRIAIRSEIFEYMDGPCRSVEYVFSFQASTLHIGCCCSYNSTRFASLSQKQNSANSTRPNGRWCQIGA